MIKYVVYDNGIRCGDYGFDNKGDDSHDTLESAVDYVMDWCGLYDKSPEFTLELNTIHRFDNGGEFFDMQIKKVCTESEYFLKEFVEFLGLLKLKDEQEFNYMTITLFQMMQLVNENCTNPYIAKLKTYESIFEALGKIRKNTDNTKTYIIHNPLTDLVKIGKSGNLSQRIRSIETMAGSDLTILKVFDTDIESELHKKFKHIRVKGEWFLYNDEIKDFIK